jgi:hypothetical protein
MKNILSSSFYPWYCKKPWYITLARLLGIPILTHKRPSANTGKENSMAKVSYETDGTKEGLSLTCHNLKYDKIPRFLHQT